MNRNLNPVEDLLLAAADDTISVEELIAAERRLSEMTKRKELLRQFKISSCRRRTDDGIPV